MHSLDEKQTVPEFPGAERVRTPVHPGSGILRRAIRGNIVSFPSQIPIFPAQHPAEMQWRMVLLFFVRGWSVAGLAERFQVPRHRVRRLLDGWSVRAMALGHVQVIDPEAFEACCGAEPEEGSDIDGNETRLVEVKPLAKSVPQSFPDAAPRLTAQTPQGPDGGRTVSGSLDSAGGSDDLISALDVAVARCDEWRGEYWVRTAAHLRDLRIAALAALEAGLSSERKVEFFATSQSGKDGLSHGLRVRDEERVSHAVA